MMKKTEEKIYYDKKTDSLWLNLKSGVEERYEEIAPGVGLEYGTKGELLGVEILNASKVLSAKMGAKLNSKASPFSVVSHKIK